MEHEEDPDIDEPYVPPVGNVLGLNADSQPPTEQPTMGETAEGQGLRVRTAPHLISTSNGQYASSFTWTI